MVDSKTGQPRMPVMKKEPRQSMSELTVRSNPKMRDPVIYPHIIQHDSTFHSLDFVYQLAEDSKDGTLYSAGKYIPLTKWKKDPSSDALKWVKVKDTPESRLL